MYPGVTTKQLILIGLIQHDLSLAGERGDPRGETDVGVQQPVQDPAGRQVAPGRGQGGEALPRGDGRPRLQQGQGPRPGQGEEARHRHHGPRQPAGHRPLQLQEAEHGQVRADAEDGDEQLARCGGRHHSPCWRGVSSLARDRSAGGGVLQVQRGRGRADHSGLPGPHRPPVQGAADHHPEGGEVAGLLSR